MGQSTDKRDSKHLGEYFPPPENIPEPAPLPPTLDDSIRFRMVTGESFVMARLTSWEAIPSDQRPDAALSEDGEWVLWQEQADAAIKEAFEAGMQAILDVYYVKSNTTGRPAA